jgi:periplasmic protein TonB
MFNLLDSSTERGPVLRPAHWLISLAVGLLGFVAGSMRLPVAADTSATQVLLVRAAVLGGALMFYALSVCYTVADARREGFNAWVWSVVVVLGTLPGFLVYLAYSALKTGDWKRATVPMAYALEVFMVGVAALVPLIYTQALPGPIRMFTFLPTLSRGGHQAAQPPHGATHHVREVDVLMTPSRIPDSIPHFAPEVPKPPDTGVGIFGIPKGPGGGQDPVLISILSPNAGPPPPSPKPAAIKRVTRTSTVEAAKAIYTPSPVYPHLAIIARVQGTVRIHAIIGADGTVQELRVISGNPLLVNAARYTVATWRYQATLLNGEPVEVETEIDVKFILSN